MARADRGDRRQDEDIEGRRRIASPEGGHSPQMSPGATADEPLPQHVGVRSPPQVGALNPKRSSNGTR